MAINPCGISYQQALKIIEDNVLTGNYNGRKEVMDGLLDAGYSYSEATEVTDTYFKIYKRVSSTFKPKPTIVPTAKEKARKRLNNMAVDYLNGKLQGFQMSSSDENKLLEFYEKADKADTPTLKEKFNEQANQFAQKFMPDYTNDLFKSNVYAKPLLSAVFFAKSITTNIHAQVERIITNTILRNPKAIDFTNLFKFGDLANQAALNVVKGGVPATSIQQTEQNLGAGKARLEEFSISGTEAESNRAKATYYKAMNLITKWSSRFNNAPDTRGIYANAERHMYELLKEKYTEEGMSVADAKQAALEHMELSDREEAVRSMTAKFNELGLPTGTSEFRVAVAEFQRRNRDNEIWSKSLELAKNDFWKRNMTVASKMGFGDYGIFGLKAQILTSIRNAVEKRSNSKAASAFNLFAFGFVNGAANFAEDAIERIPLYAAVKFGALQYKKGSADAELAKDIARRQRDIIAKNIMTFTFFVAAKMAEELLCDEYAGRQSTKEISSGRVQTGICGIPMIIPPQLMVSYKLYKMIDEATDNDEDFWNSVLNMMPVIMQENQMGLSGTLDKVSEGAAKMVTAKANGQETYFREEGKKMMSNVVKSAVGYANSFLPIPSRLLSEAATVTTRTFERKAQPQMDLPFAIDEMGREKGWMASFGKVSVAALGNVTGINDIALAASGAQKTYAVDWLGRKVLQFRGSDIVGSGIQYTSADDIVASAGVATPYLSRLSKVTTEKIKEKSKDVTGGDVTSEVVKARYMTDEEFFNANVGMAMFNKEFFKEHEEGLVEMVKEDREDANKYLNGVFKKVKKRAVEAINEGMVTSEEVYGYISKSMQEDRRRARKTTKTVMETAEEETEEEE